MSIPFFNENPLIQFEQNHPFHNYLEFQSQNDLSVERNLEIEKKWKRKKIRQNFNSNFISTLNHSFKFNFLKLVFCSIIIGCIIYILNVPEDCHGPFYLWLLLFLLHDILKLSLIVRRLILLIINRLQICKRSNQDESESSSPNYDSSLQLMDLESYIRNFESQRSTLSSEKINEEHFHLWTRIFKVLEEFSKIYYWVLFVFGNVLLFSETNCSYDRTPHYWYLFMGFMVFFYLALLFAIFYLYSVFNNLFVFLKISIFFGVLSRYDNNEQFFNQLKPKEGRNRQINDDYECPICLKSIEKDHPVIDFSCNDKHNFHKKCAKEWFSIFGTCPLCKKSFEVLENILNSSNN